jgi:hypothetical protein
MKKYFFTNMLVLCILISGVAAAENQATYNFETGVLEVPRVVTDYGDYSTEFQQDADGRFSLTKASITQSHNIGDSSINGGYDGQRELEPADITVSISGSDIFMSIDAFFSGEYRLTGTISSDHSMASGTYQASDFTSGTWSSRKINTVTTYDGSILIAVVNLISDSGSNYLWTVFGIDYD